MSNRADIIAMNFEASTAVGAVTCSQGGVPINGGHIQYWMGQAREARVERDTAITDGSDRISELNAEITKLRAERDAAARDMVLVPTAALLWLTGEAPDADGKWFGETIGEGLPKVAGKYPRTYWWRSKFRSMVPNWPTAPAVIATVREGDAT